MADRIRIINKKGEVKFVSENIANNAKLLKQYGFEVQDLNVDKNEVGWVDNPEMANCKTTVIQPAILPNDGYFISGAAFNLDADEIKQIELEQNYQNSIKHDIMPEGTEPEPEIEYKIPTEEAVEETEEKEAEPVEKPKAKRGPKQKINGN